MLSVQWHPLRNQNTTLLVLKSSFPKYVRLSSSQLKEKKIYCIVQNLWEGDLKKLFYLHKTTYVTVWCSWSIKHSTGNPILHNCNISIFGTLRYKGILCILLKKIERTDTVKKKNLNAAVTRGVMFAFKACKHVF